MAVPISVAQISFFSDPQHREPERLLQDWHTVAMTADAALLGGARVTVIQASIHTQALSRRGVDYHFLPLAPSMAGLQDLLARLRPDVLHVQGLGFTREVLDLKALAPEIPIALQHRADRPPRRPWAWPDWRRSLSTAKGLMFCSREQAGPFRRRGMVGGATRIYELPGLSSAFVRQDPDEARRLTGLHGSPCLLWVGNLDRNKDPLTVLEGVALAARHLPKLTLWCCFGKAPLLDAVKAAIADHPALSGRVYLLGQVPLARVEQLMNAADFLVQGSHHESTGSSLLEALACGLSPLVTNIPSFRALTGNGAVGQLWTPGRADQLAAAILHAAAEPADVRRAQVRAHFEAHGSPLALGRKLVAVYEDLLKP